MNESYDVLIVGGGTAGVTVAARLKRARRNLSVAIVEPADRHYYQPMWTLVGAGVATRESTAKPMASVIPAGVSWIRDAVVSFAPQEQVVTTRDGRRIGYTQLVVAPGIKILWDTIDGLVDAIGHDGVCSNYAYDYVPSTWETLRSVTSGNAVFTNPNTPVKCGGAPLKIMFLTDHYLRRQGRRDDVAVIFATAGGGLFGVPKYRDTVERLVSEREIGVRLRHNLIAVRPDTREAVFERLDTGEEVPIHYSMLHVTPPMGPPDFIQASPLADEHGWVDVDRDTLRHVRYPDVFALGDASNLPTSRTGAAVRKQAPVLVANLLASREGEPLTATYDGYTSCPVVTGYGELMMAEFNYDLEPEETFPFDQAKPRRSMWWVKRYLLPQMYWHGMLKGRV